ncbi:MAG: transglycosylase domain-containing protein [Cytophagaceae bacterium]|nr:transglycosylase domain-containing protein [Cytophagaceae bacterium]
MQPTTRRVLRITGWSLLSLLVLTGVATAVAFNKREALLRTVLERSIQKADRSYGLRVTMDSARFVGPTTVAFSNVVVVPAQRDTLVRLSKVEVGVNPWPMLFGKVRLTRLLIHDGLVHAVQRDSVSNLDFLFRRKSVDSSAARQRVNLADVAEKLTDNLLGTIPDDLDIRNVELRLTDDARRVSLLAETALMDNEELASTIRVNGNEAAWHLNGHLDGSSEEADLALFADNKPLELGYLQERFGLSLQLDRLQIQLSDVDRSGGELQLKGASSVQNLRLYHPALAADTVLVASAGMDAVLAVGENYIGLDSASVLRLDKVQARPFVRYTLSPVKIYDLVLRTDALPAQDLFDSFPQGLFESVEGIKVAGTLRYDFRLHLDSSQPDSVQFDAGLTPTDFRILQFGGTDFTRLNQPFDYTPYERGKPMRTIRVGPENPDFTPLTGISKNLRNAVLTAEDYTFFQHKGFNEKAFRVSIATNFKSKSFKRGGSTISMQLVKNAFLSRHKDLARKVEEILIVWLIENQRLIPKERMYEVYLNIIEWGRNVYGIGEASRYYFAKNPGELTLGESLFLAYVVPSPKSALNHFSSDGSLRTSLRGYFKFVGRIMTRRGLAPSDTSAYGFYGVQLREGLRKQLFPYDTSGYESDSLLTVPDPETEGGGGGINDFFRRLFNRDKEGDDEELNPEKAPTPTTPNPILLPEEPVTDKSKKELRQERREQRQREREGQLKVEN